MRASTGITSGQWQTSAHLFDYRTEWFSSMLVERATWLPNAPLQRIGETVIASPGFVWLRFWLLESDDVVEKYLDARGHAIGYYIPICTPLDRRGTQLYVGTLKLALWMQASGQLTVLGEETFEQAVKVGELTPVEAEHAEYRIRTLTTAIHQKRFPPAIVRNFTLAE
jgi:predicted RNA-binding protein associated with RNAse of E/G family